MRQLVYHRLSMPHIDYAQTMRLLCTHYVSEPFWICTAGPAMRPPGVHYAPLSTPYIDYTPIMSPLVVSAVWG